MASDRYDAVVAGLSCVACGTAGATWRCPQCEMAVAPGGYLVEGVLAQTQFSRVYRVRGPDGAVYALKELVFVKSPGAREVDAFRREIDVLRQLDHPSIPRIFEHFQEGEGAGLRFYLVQEFIEGETLQLRLERRRFAEEEVLAIAREVLPVLAYLHSRSPRVIHRDIKPSNLIRDGSGHIHLIDFGAVRTVDDVQTFRGTLVGTFGYMPVEQMGGTVDLSSDLYALGATLLHLLSRRPPGEMLDPDMRLAFERHVNVSPRTGAWLGKLVARDPERRFRTATAALEALNAPAPRNGRLRWGLAASAVLACAAVLVALQTHRAGVQAREGAPESAAASGRPSEASPTDSSDGAFVIAPPPPLDRMMHLNPERLGMFSTTDKCALYRRVAFSPLQVRTAADGNGTNYTFVELELRITRASESPAGECRSTIMYFWDDDGQRTAASYQPLETGRRLRSEGPVDIVPLWFRFPAGKTRLRGSVGSLDAIYRLDLDRRTFTLDQATP